MKNFSAVIIVFFFLILLPSGFPQSMQRFVKTVIIDAGHGGKDPGTTGLSGIYEKEIVLNIALKVKEMLTENYDDLNIVLTRSTDEFVEVKQRGVIANESKGDLFVSIHCNAKKTEENDKSGFEIYLLDLARIQESILITKSQNLLYEFTGIMSDTSEKNLILTSLLANAYYKYSENFASVLQYTLATETNLESRGVMQAGYWVLLSASMPTVLVECGYLSNAKDEPYLKSAAGQQQIAKGIYKAIRLYKFDYEYANK
jgi:N-acetylmuramoyl-L-alanine amidase